MFKVTLKCLDYKGPAVNWTKEMSKEEVLETVNEMGLNENKLDWVNEYTYNFKEFASAYRLTITPIK